MLQRHLGTVPAPLAAPGLVLPSLPRLGRHEMQVHHFEPEADDPLHQSPHGPLIWQPGNQGCRVRAHDHCAVVKFGA